MAQKRVVSQLLTIGELRENAEYFVEELRRNRWRRVSGPFTKKQQADQAAQRYSAENPGVRVRVIVFH